MLCCYNTGEGRREKREGERKGKERRKGGRGRDREKEERERGAVLTEGANMLVCGGRSDLITTTLMPVFSVSIYI